MDVLRQWAICITVSALVSAVIYAVSPKGNIQKAMKVIISVFFLCAILSPFLSGNVMEFDFETQDYMSNKNEQNVELNENINAQMLEISKGMIEEQTQSIFYSNQIYNGQIYADMDIDSSGSIFIKAMTIKLPKKDMIKKAEVIDSVCNRFGIELKIITITETENDEG
ncbi:MAG: hypothetical protein EOM05_05090 [Clostridia bacterium]|nr:hypothetical protein [Clostridia bacterium]